MLYSPLQKYVVLLFPRVVPSNGRINEADSLNYFGV